MNETDLETDVIATLRRSALGGSDREIRTADELGELGLGLDSLALVEFVTALEKRYGIQFPDDFWFERGQLTLQHFIDVIAESKSSPEPSPTNSEAAIDREAPVDELPASRFEAIAAVFSSEGWLRGSYWLLKKLLGKIYRVEQKRIILLYDLEQNEISQYEPNIDIELRIADLNDEKALGRIEGVPYDKTMNTDQFKSRLDSDFLCFVAYHDGKVIGVDWTSPHGNEEYGTIGLAFEMEKESCYGLELYEDRSYAGKGVGLALLTYSLAVCKERGYARQIGWVNADNTRMLSSSVQLFGARKIGEFRVRKIFNRPFTTWSIEGKKGTGRVIRL